MTQDEWERVRQTCNKDKLDDKCPQCDGSRRGKGCWCKQGLWDPPIRHMDFTKEWGKPPGTSRKRTTNVFEPPSEFKPKRNKTKPHVNSRGSVLFVEMMANEMRRRLSLTTAKLNKPSKEHRALERAVILKNKADKLNSEALPIEIRPLTKAFDKSMGCVEGQERILQAHVGHTVQEIEAKARNDALKMIQLGEAVVNRLKGVAVTAPKHVKRWGCVMNSLQNHFKTLQDACSGRHPNVIRAGQQAVAVATSNKVPIGHLKAVAKTVGASCDQLRIAKTKWHDIVEGEVKDLLSLMELRGKVRKDKMSDEMTDFTISVWNDNTRASERKKDSMRNPKERRNADARLHRMHWLEMRLVDMHKLAFNPNPDPNCNPKPMD